MNDHAFDEVEKLLGEITPRGAPPELRSAILDGIDQQVTREATWTKEKRWSLAMAALLFLALGFNGWVDWSETRREARIYGAEPTPAKIVELVDAIESVSGPETGNWFARQLIHQQKAIDRASSSRMTLHRAEQREVQRLLNDLGIVFES